MQAAIVYCALSSKRFHLIIYIFLHQLTDSPHGVDWEPLVGVDSNTEEAGVGVDQPLDIALLQIEQDRRVIEICQAGHVLAAVILGRIDLNVGILKLFFWHKKYECAMAMVQCASKGECKKLNLIKLTVIFMLFQ